MPQPNKIVSPENNRFSFANAVSFSYDAKATDKKSRKFSGTAYSGDVIKGHWYWGDVVFDLASTTMASKVPSLIDHDPNMRAGFTDTNVIDLTNGIVINGTLLSTEYGDMVAKESDEGFPWQMSVQITPNSIEEVSAGSTVMVNNRTFIGPLTIFRNSTVVEVSFCALGWDSKTSAAAMSRTTPQEGNDDMSKEVIEKLQADLAAMGAVNAELVAANKASNDALLAFTKASREAEVSSLFKDIGKEYKADSDEVKTFLSMDSTAFSVVASTLRASKPTTTANSLLFGEQATAGADPQATQEDPLIKAAKRSAEQFAKRKLA